MRNKQPSDPSKTGLPVPAASADAVPVLTKHAQLDADLGALDRGLYEWAFGSEELLSCLKAALPFIEKWRADWRALDRPATTDEIATQMLRLATTMPNAGNIDQGMLADTLCEDIAELRPTAWAVERGCRAHRGKSEFLSFAKLEEEIRHAERRARRYRRLLERDLVEDLKLAEDSAAMLKSAEHERQQKLHEKGPAEIAEEERETARWLRDIEAPWLIRGSTLAPPSARGRATDE
jgi:hypothetical protein